MDTFRIEALKSEEQKLAGNGNSLIIANRTTPVLLNKIYNIDSNKGNQYEYMDISFTSKEVRKQLLRYIYI